MFSLTIIFTWYNFFRIFLLGHEAVLVELYNRSCNKEVGQMVNNQKKNRVLDIFYRAFKGEELSVSNLASEYEVSTKSITSDINEIKNFLADNRDVVGNSELLYSYQSKTYSLKFDHFLVSKELVAIVKILVGCRALSKEELLELIAKLKNLTDLQDRKLLEQVIRNEMYHYHEVHHDCKSVIDNLWQLSRVIDQKILITITYYKQDRSEVERKLKPLALLFSENYFYLLAYEEEKEEIAKYFRVDRITRVVEHRKHFVIEKHFDEGELKQEIQYMYPGVYRKIKFEFTGPSIQAVLDRIPTAKIIEKEGNKYLVEARVYGRGINMFLLSQGKWVKVLEPVDFVQEMKKEVKELYDLYY